MHPIHSFTLLSLLTLSTGSALPPTSTPFPRSLGRARSRSPLHPRSPGPAVNGNANTDTAWIREIDPARLIRSGRDVELIFRSNSRGTDEDQDQDQDEIEIESGDENGEREKRTVGSVSGLSTHSGIYTYPLSLGNPPKSYPLQIDTASSDLLVLSTACNASSCPRLRSDWIGEHGIRVPTGDHEGMDRDGSLQVKEEDGWIVRYADGSGMAGSIGSDFVHLDTFISSLASSRSDSDSDENTSNGSASNASHASTYSFRQTIGLIDTTTIDLEAEGSVGVWGLGFPRGAVLGRVGLGSQSQGQSQGQSQSQSGSQSTASASSTASSGSSGSTRSSAIASSAVTLGSTSSSSGGGFFTILPVGTITTSTSTSSSPTSTSSSTKRKRSSLHPTYYPTFLESLFNPVNTTEPLSYPVFALALANSSAPFSDRNSGASLTFGGVSAEFVDESVQGRRVGDIEWNRVVPYGRANGYPPASPPSTTQTEEGQTITSEELEGEHYLYWTLELGSVSMNGTRISLSPTYPSEYTGLTGSGTTAILDVGSNGISAPQQDVISLFSHITNARQVSQGQWAVPCDTRQTMSFSFSSDRHVTLQPSEWISAQIEGSSMCLAWPVVARPNSDSDWQLGTPFLRKVYTVFAYGIEGEQGALVGFLPLPDPSEGGNATTTTTTTTTSATPTSIESLQEVQSLVTITAATVLPNVILPNPTYTTPPYAFNTSAGIPTLGAVQTLGLANGSVYTVGDVPIVTSVEHTVTATATGTGTGTRGVPDSGSANATNGAVGMERDPLGMLVISLISCVLVALMTSS